MTTPIGGGEEEAFSIAIQTDGKIVVAGYSDAGGSDDIALVRYNPDLSLDTSFDGDGIVTTPIGPSNERANAVAIQNDGKIVVTGYTWSGTSYDIATVRYNSDGSLDTTFDTDAVVTTPIGSGDDGGQAVVIQSDGKIIVAGYSDTGADYDIALVRYNSDGSPDNSFDADGVVTTPIGAGDDRGEAVAIQGDGRIVVAGNTLNGGLRDFAVARYNTDGSLDTTFDTDGKVTTNIASDEDNARSVVIQSDGKIVVAGYTMGSDYDFALIRYNSDGSLDTSFDTDGVQITDFGAGDDVGYGVALQTDGRIVVAGYSFSGGNADFAVVRYTTDGSLDNSFDTDGIVTTPIGTSHDHCYGIAIQSDGKIVVAGSTDTGSNFDIAVVRYDNNVSQDDGCGCFASQGKVITPVGTGSDYASAVVIQPDGKIVVAGYSYNGLNYDIAVVRYDTDGSLDPSFGTGGIVTTPIGTGNDSGNALTLQPDGKIVVTGYTHNGSNNDIVVVRYNSDGSLDTSFDGDGKLSTTIGSGDDLGEGIVIQPDGKIVVAGSSWNGSDHDFAAVRYNSDGSLDTGFSGDGKVTTSIGSITDQGYDVALQSDGKIVVAGYSHNGTDADFAAVRYYSDGTLDNSFSGDGKVTTSIGMDQDVGHIVALQSDGKILVAGYSNNGPDYDFALVRYNIDGSLDTTLDTDGKLTTDLGGSGEEAQGLAVQPDGKIVVAGSSDSGGDWDFAAVRYNQDGSVDASFHNDGKVTADFGNGDDRGFAIAVQLDGRIVVAGYADGGPDDDFAVVRLYANGGLDDGGCGCFATGGGKVITAVSPDTDHIRGIAVQPDGKIVACGNSYNGSDYDVAVVRYCENGCLDPTFGMGGIVTTPVGSSVDYGYSVAVQADGKIVVAGRSLIGANYDFAVLRYNSDGSLDTSFDSDGIVTTPIGTNDDTGLAVAIQSDGKIVVSGYSRIGMNFDFAVVRYNGDGSLDTSFDTDGKVTTSVGSNNAYGQAIAIQPDGKIVVAGRASSGGDDDFAVVRYNSDGSLDTTFDADGGVITSIGSGNDWGYGVALQPDNKIVVAGYSWNGGDYDFAAVRYLADGSLDTGFDTDGKVTTDFGGGHDYGEDVVIQPDGKIVVAGSSNNADEDFAVVRYNGDGSLDTTFDADGKVTTPITGADVGVATALQPDGKILVGGGTWDINEDFAVVRYSSDGSPDDVCTPTAVELQSFSATGLDGEVLVEWATASEIDNLGFYLYRSEWEVGPYERVNAVAVPGLGSSPVGASYRYVDSGLVNGKTYYYELEDFEASGKRERHGPVSATPTAGATLEPSEEGGAEDGHSTPSRITYGDPESVSFRVKNQGRGSLVLELETGGFYAEPQSDGSVRLSVPGFAEEFEAGTPAIPVKRSWVEALAGKHVRITSVRAKDVTRFSLRPSSADAPVIDVSRRGAIRAARRPRRGGAAFGGKGLYPEEAAGVVSVGFQEDVKKALLELAPLRWDGNTRHLLLARHLEVQVVFDGRVAEERSLGGSRGRLYRRRRTPRAATVVAHLATQERGLYGVRFEDLFGSSRRAVNVGLSRQGEAVPYYVRPNPRLFDPGSVLYFVSEGERLNPYGKEAVYELEVGREGERMEEVQALPSGPTLTNYRHSEEVEGNHYISIDSEEEPYWIWDVVMSGGSKAYGFEVSSLGETVESGNLTVWLAGVSSEEEKPAIRARVYVNGERVSEASWVKSGVQPFTMDIAPGVLREGENTLVLENASPSRYTALILDRFHVSYPRMAITEEGVLRGVWSQTGTAEVMGLSEKTYVLDVTQTPQWIAKVDAGTGGVRFRAEADHEYMVISDSSVLKPEVRRSVSSGLKNKSNRADYIIVGPREMLPTAAPLLELRRSQGLRAKGVAIEDVYAEFGHGEARPEGLRDFFRYAYHEWRSPRLRYVLLLGDGTYDYKGYLQTEETNQVPPRWEKTTWMWTASDPSYARVNGDDVLPDIAIGRLPASTQEEARVMVEKIVAYETSGQNLTDTVVLVADDRDEAGDFETDAEELAGSALAGLDPKKIYLGRLGEAATRAEIQDAMNAGASLVSYLGHGAVHIWAHENIFNTSTIQSLLPREKQPLVLTINCLNGFFHYPHFDALAEELVKAEGKGAVAAFSPSGLSLNTPAHRFHRALLEELLSGNHAVLGDSVLAAQARYAEEGSFLELLGIFHLFGDPAMRLLR